jgi:hypothetical protein
MNNTIQNQKTLNEMIAHIAEEKTLRQLLSSYEIAEVREILNIEHYERGKDRKGIIVDVKEDNGLEKTKILIDLRLGQPSIYQVYDALYDVGKDCDIKIIVHTNGYNDFDEDIPVVDEYAVLSLVAQLQEDNVAVVLFKIDRSKMEIEYIDLFQDWNQVHRLRRCDIPTREQFMAETFWALYFDSFSGMFYEPHKSFQNGFRDINDWGHLIYIDDCPIRGEIQLYWDQKGVRYVIGQNDGLVGLLNEVLDIEMPWIFDRYGVGAVEFMKTDKQSSSLQIKYSDRPFDWLFTATPRQIYEFAKSLHEDAWELRWRLEDTINGYCKSMSA